MSMATDYRITEQLRKAIRNSGLSGYRICKLTGIDKSALSRFTSGERGLSMENMDAIATLLKVKLAAYTDKLASKALLAEHEKAVARGEQGLTDPFKDQRNRPITEHLADWLVELRQNGRSEVYAKQCDGRISRLIRECGWELLEDIDSDSLMTWRETATSDIAHNRKDKSELQPTSMGPRTQNHYLVALISFCRWCVKRKRMPSNLMIDVDKVDQSSDARRARRALTREEVKALLAAVPQQYKLVYRVLLSTGLRRAEAAQFEMG
jgi:integrase